MKIEAFALSFLGNFILPISFILKALQTNEGSMETADIISNQQILVHAL